MPNFRKFRLFLLMVLVCSVLGFSQSALAGDIVLNDLNGRSVNLSSYKGKPVILFFWTTWCPYCREELKKINLQSSQMAQEGIVVLGINLKEADYKVQRFFKGYRLNFKILLDKSALLADKYDLLGVPTYIFLNSNAEVVAKRHNLPDNYKSLLLK
jgi:peroxiredoxin